MNDDLLDLMNKIMEKNPFSKELGMELLYVEPGYAKAKLKLEHRLLNVQGNLHGGSSYTMGDVLAGVASSAYGYYTTTINGNFNYLESIANTEYVYGEAKVVRQGETIGVYDIKITNDEGKIVATGVFTYYKTKIKINVDDFVE
jgi:acyl-CoA thioesterase